MKVCPALVVLVGCSSAANVPIDASPDAPISPGGHQSENCSTRIDVSCSGSSASITSSMFAPSPMYHCSAQGVSTVNEVMCSGGCAVTIAMQYTDGQIFQNAVEVPRVMCAETPSARAGDACSAANCLPTRAILASDGTVVSQTYLSCVDSACAVRSAPMLAGYLTACDATTIQTYGGPNVTGQTGSCLLAWDATTQTTASGQTRACIGDWDCPEGALCDDQLMSLGSALAVCKPGPRGTLTPAMLSAN